MALRERGYASPRNEWQLKKQKLSRLLKIGALAASGAVTPPVVNLPGLSFSDVNTTPGSVLVNDTVIFSATTSDSDTFVTTGVDLYESGNLVGHFTGGSGLWSYRLDNITAGNKSYTARRIFAGGSSDSAAQAFTVLDVLAPNQVTSATLLAWYRATESIQMGPTPEPTGTSPPAITFTTTSSFVSRTEQITITVPVGGTRGTAQLNVALNGNAVLTNVVTAATIAIPGTDLTINCPAGTYNTNNVYKSTCQHWLDKVGSFPTSTANYDNVPSGTVIRPYIINPGALGAVCIKFDGIDDVLTNTGGPVVTQMSGADKTFYCLAMVNWTTLPAGGSNGTLWSLTNLTDTDLPRVEFTAFGTGPVWSATRRDDAGVSHNVQSHIPPTTGSHLLEVGDNGSAAIFRDNSADVIGGQSDVPSTSLHPSTITATQVVLGERNDQGGQSGRGAFELYELIFFDHEPSALDLARLRLYIQA